MLRAEAKAACRRYRLTGKFLGWLVKDKQIVPHIPVWEKSDRAAGIFSRVDFIWDKRHGHYICPNGKRLRTSGTVHDGRMLLYRASKRDWVCKRVCTGTRPQDPRYPRRCPRCGSPEDEDESVRQVA